MKAVKMNETSVKAWLLAHSAMEADNYGNFKQTTNSGKTYRIKFQKISIRFEVQVVFPASEYSPKRTEWMLIEGVYFKDIRITDDNKLVIGKRQLVSVK